MILTSIATTTLVVSTILTVVLLLTALLTTIRGAIVVACHCYSDPTTVMFFHNDPHQ